MAPKKMSLGEFLTDQEFGDWADDDIDINSISVPIGKPVTHHDAYHGYGGNHYRSNQRDFPVLQGPPFIAKFSNIPETATRVLIKDLFESRFCNYDRIKLLIDPHPPSLSRMGTDNQQRRKCAFVQVASAAILQKVLKWQDLNLGRIRISVACADRDDFQNILDYNKNIGYDDEAEEIQYKLGKQPRRASVVEPAVASSKQEVNTSRGDKSTDIASEHSSEVPIATKKPVTILKREEPSVGVTTQAFVPKINPFGAAKPVKTVPEDILETKETKSEPEPAPKMNPFGAAKPVNILAKEKEIEEKLKQLEREKEKAKEEARKEKERKEHERKEKEREKRERQKEKQREKLKERQKQKALELEKQKEMEIEREKEKANQKEREKKHEGEKGNNHTERMETEKVKVEESGPEQETELRKEMEKKQPFRFKKKERGHRQPTSDKDLESQKPENKLFERAKKNLFGRESKSPTRDQKDKSFVSSTSNSDNRAHHRTIKQFHNKTYRRPDLVDSPSNVIASDSVVNLPNEKESTLPKDKSGDELRNESGNKSNGYAGHLNHSERKERGFHRDQDRKPKSDPKSRDNGKIEPDKPTSSKAIAQPAQPKDTEGVESEASQFDRASTSRPHRNGTRDYKTKRKSQVFHNKRYVRKDGNSPTGVEETKREASSKTPNAEVGNQE